MKYDLHPIRFGLVLSLISILLGFMLGGAFGYREDAIKGSLAASAAAVRESAYKGDDAAIKKTIDKSWAYLQRAHLHWGALGTAALAQCLLLGLLGIHDRLKLATSLMLGVGATGYGLFWLVAGFRAPGLGGTGPAKESLKWLAQPTSFFCVLGTAIVFFGACRLLFPGNASKP